MHCHCSRTKCVWDLFNNVVINVRIGEHKGFFLDYFMIKMPLKCFDAIQIVAYLRVICFIHACLQGYIR